MNFVAGEYHFRHWVVWCLTSGLSFWKFCKMILSQNFCRRLFSQIANVVERKCSRGRIFVHKFYNARMLISLHMWVLFWPSRVLWMQQHISHPRSVILPSFAVIEPGVKGIVTDKNHHCSHGCLVAELTATSCGRHPCGDSKQRCSLLATSRRWALVWIHDCSCSLHTERRKIVCSNWKKKQTKNHWCRKLLCRLRKPTRSHFSANVTFRGFWK